MRHRLATKLMDFWARRTDKAAEPGSVFPEIDYVNHPYYRELRANAGAEDRKQALEAFQAEYSKLLAAQTRHQLYLKTHQPPEIPADLRDAVGRMNDEGILPMRLSDEDRRAAIAMTEKAAADLLESRLTKTPEERSVQGVSTVLAHTDKKDATFEFFDALLRKHHIYDIAHCHKAMPYKLKFVALQINQDDDRGILFKSSFEDGTRADTFYMHIDSTVDVLKIIMYRTPEVTPETGAFRYLPTTYRMSSPRDLVIRKANDKTNMDMMYNPNKRRKFATLPPEFQKKAAFGNDLLPGDPRMGPLLKLEQFYGTDRCDMLLFNPDGIHRGAIFERPGQRQIFQLLLIPAI